MPEKDIFDKVIDYIDAMSDEDFFSLVKECEESPGVSFAIAEENSYEYLSVKNFEAEKKMKAKEKSSKKAVSPQKNWLMTQELPPIQIGNTATSKFFLARI